jgi:hypothetical protein
LLARRFSRLDFESLASGMSYNSKDPFDAAAWWFMQISCQDCGTMLGYDLNTPSKGGSDDYWHEYGQRAKQQGWQIVEQTVSPPGWLILCPACVKKRTDSGRL